MGITLPNLALKVEHKQIFKFIFALTFILSLTVIVNAQTGSVGIGTNDPNPKTVLDIVSSDKGILIPRLTEEKRDELLTPGNFDDTFNGLLIYNLTAKAFNAWTDDRWDPIGGTAGADGDKGDPGTPGSKWFIGQDHPNIDPAAAIKNAGDFYLQKSGNKVWQYLNGSWMDMGNLSAGTPGKDGKSITGAAINSDGKLVLTLSDGITTSTVTTVDVVKGEKGDNGLTAYEIWESQPANNGKTLAQYLTEMTGTDGESAYEIWESQPANNGKTVTQFITEITGTDGQSAYELWESQPANNGKSVAQFLTEITGTDGQSAYELWESQPANNGKTEAQFLTEITGADGLSAYEIWESQLANNGKSVAQFLAEMKGVDGAPGSKWYTGITDPTVTPPAPAVDGDMYFDSSTNTIWEKITGTWTNTNVTINPTNAWSLTGNANTAGDISNYMGTSDAQPLIIATNGTENMRVLVGGNIGINTESPTAKLHVAGDVKIGLQGDAINKILKASISRNVTSIGAGAQKIEVFSMPKCSMNSIVTVSPELFLPPGVIISYARVATPAIGAIPGTVEVAFWNANTTAQDPDSMKYNILVVE